MPTGRLLRIEVAFALPCRQRLISLEVEPHTTAAEAVERANLPGLFPEVPDAIFRQPAIGIFGKVLRAPHSYRLRDGDRVEVYRPLVIDPKAARQARAQRQRDR